MSSNLINPLDAVHRRFNPLTNSWVLCSPHRARRPWLGQSEKPGDAQLPEYEAKCALCPGNSRNPAVPANPQYESTFSFPNDFAALSDPQQDPITAPTPNNASSVESALLRSAPAAGKCSVVCFSPKHNMSLAEMSAPDIHKVLVEWTRLEREIHAESPTIEWVQFFENKGAAMGCSQPHPHSQAWATDYIPNEPHTEFVALTEFSRNHAGKCLLCEYVALEVQKQERVVFENEHFVVVVPYWATWPFETMILSKSHTASLSSLSTPQSLSLAEAIQAITIRYDNLFETSFPYSMGVHGAPLTQTSEFYKAAHLHLHFYPPLLRSATVRKFLVGFEMLGEAQRDLTAEMAAGRLRDVEGVVHYKLKK
ncbi:galactose-1-phosphate uridyl transferase [Podochytrium sp. JEL0797]|nr:galactose-1-phosphate uridyl transferase [Podochytrium sp. JEL0797]